MASVRSITKTLLFGELLQGLAVTFKYLWKPKFTVHYPEERAPQSVRYRGLHALRRASLRTSPFSLAPFIDPYSTKSL